jgi:hypothetical protein
MKRIIIFRFHKSLRVCQNRLKHIQKLNPRIPIHGVYGGEERSFALYKKSLGTYFTTLHCITGHSATWKWQNFDLALREWYKKIGHTIDFDIAHVIEWDLLITEPIERAYAGIGKNELGLTGLTPLSKMHDWYWMTVEPHRSESQELLKFVKKKYRYARRPYASLGPGLSVPRVFLQKYAAADVPELAHDELRVPLYAQIFGFTCKNTFFEKEAKNESEYFNCDNEPIRLSTIKRELKKPRGRRVFHPFRGYFQ